ncbi:MAG: FHA domain-containing protein [Gammaproteobacteria bacterium]|nr:FHA domain-containing protein [Gammaproteobacteria bacterium]NNF61372.1 FHA domain-containing protein [Gammaproteobacteria bacterium]
MVQPTDTVTSDIPERPQRTGGARIVVTYKGKRIAKYRLAKRKIMIGRRHDCDIRINSRSASRHHAQIFSVLDEDYVLDLDSKNGTFVNARRVKKHTLEDGDVVSIGGFDLAYSRATTPSE